MGPAGDQQQERGPDVWPLRLTIGGMSLAVVSVVAGMVLLASLRADIPRDLIIIGTSAISALAALLPGIKLRH